MQIRQFHLHGQSAATDAATAQDAIALDPHLVLVFGAPDGLGADGLHAQLRRDFPRARLAGCSTAGQISAAGVTDDRVVVTAMRFRQPEFSIASTELSAASDSRDAGRRLGAQLLATSPHTAVVFSQGVGVNGSALIEGIADVLGPSVNIAGGLAGDNGAFQRTLVLSDDGVSDTSVVAIGLHGESLRISHGSYGGWQPFGPVRRVTRANGNVLYSIDDEPALDLYKRYLGDHAARLPGSGLLFPFALLGADYGDLGLIRTILGVDEDARSLIMAGDLPTDCHVQLMHARADQLIDGAEAAANCARTDEAHDGDVLSLMVSCVGRRLVLGDRVDEEVEAVAHAMGGDDVVAGFYSYGEISPSQPGGLCHLHNQTMTISRWVERA